ncbi:hypothetical protein RF11_11599 [Thelohanellus kitauei]|uniref:Uncharacterized protein n=1 Tax=Thelohanellus kitauei TaxID=669202 RepID=A0A0C2IWS0_THEKT|nr:hypothetical protein RF11_11599 [Thelohanellus kitauei]
MYSRGLVLFSLFISVNSEVPNSIIQACYKIFTGESYYDVRIGLQMNVQFSESNTNEDSGIVGEVSLNETDIDLDTSLIDGADIAIHFKKEGISVSFSWRYILDQTKSILQLSQTKVLFESATSGETIINVNKIPFTLDKNKNHEILDFNQELILGKKKLIITISSLSLSILDGVLSQERYVSQQRYIVLGECVAESGGNRVIDLNISVTADQRSPVVQARSDTFTVERNPIALSQKLASVDQSQPVKNMTQGWNVEHKMSDLGNLLPLVFVITSSVLIIFGVIWTCNYVRA